MQTFTMTRDATNVEALDTTLRAALGSPFSGISTHAGIVTVHLADEVSQEQIAQAQLIVETHDPALLTADQRASNDQQQALTAARNANITPLNGDDYTTESALIQQLAHKIAWLEQEITDLRRL